MNLIIAIDAFRLSCEPFTSNAVYVEELARSFSLNPAIGNIYLLLPEKPGQDFKYAHLENSDKVRFIYPRKSYNPNKNWLLQTLWMQKGVLECLNKLDKVNVLISPYHQVPVLLPKHIKSVVVMHDICGLDTNLYPRTKKGFYKHYYNFITSLLRADVLVPISQFTREQFLGKFPSTEKKMSKVVYNNISSQMIGEEIMYNTLLKYNLRNQSFFLVIGAMSSRKGIDLIVEAWKIYESKGGGATLFMVVGRHQTVEMKNLLDNNGITNYKIITGVTSEERDSLYRGALALLFPSRCEGFGFPILEAMVQGCPPIAWQKSPAAEIVGDDNLLLRTLEPGEIVEFLFKYGSLSGVVKEDLSNKLKARSKSFMKDDFGTKFYEAMTEVASFNKQKQQSTSHII